MGANAQTTVPKYTALTVLPAASMNISAGTGIPVFASTVTRDAAFGGANKVLAEGQTCYLEDTNTVQYYNGATWQTLGLDNWTTYTPTLEQGVTVTKAVNYAKYIQVGKMVTVEVSMTVTSSGTTSAIIKSSLPTVPVVSGQTMPIGVGVILSGTFRSGMAFYTGVDALVFMRDGGSNWIGADPSLTLVSGNTVGFTVTYETA